MPLHYLVPRVARDADAIACTPEAAEASRLCGFELLVLSSMLELPAGIHDQMIDQARAEAPSECCGILAGTGSTVLRLFPLRNGLASPVAYQADVHDLFAAFREMRKTGLDLLAIYHSHPASPARPSAVDLAENYYGDIPRIIVSLASDPPEVKAFRLYEDRYEEVPIGGLGTSDC